MPPVPAPALEAQRPERQVQVVMDDNDLIDLVKTFDVGDGTARQVHKGERFQEKMGGKFIEVAFKNGFFDGIALMAL